MTTITLPDGTTVEDDNHLNAMQAAAFFDQRRVMEANDVAIEFFQEDARAVDGESYWTEGSLERLIEKSLDKQRRAAERQKVSR